MGAVPSASQLAVSTRALFAWVPWRGRASTALRTARGTRASTKRAKRRVGECTSLQTARRTRASIAMVAWTASVHISTQTAKRKWGGTIAASMWGRRCAGVQIGGRRGGCGMASLLKRYPLTWPTGLPARSATPPRSSGAWKRWSSTRHVMVRAPWVMQATAQSARVLPQLPVLRGSREGHVLIRCSTARRSRALSTEDRSMRCKRWCRLERRVWCSVSRELSYQYAARLSACPPAGWLIDVRRGVGGGVACRPTCLVLSGLACVRPASPLLFF
mmetsp:Transcript_47316/g.94348  ORF Transcript_47316/g.94348 Transcript_47316/m.94348 type:complete len:274 (+) Transcript_47316:1453-2274(+)